MSSHLALIHQLLLVNELPEWAVYVALHLPDTAGEEAERRKTGNVIVIKIEVEVQQAHCPSLRRVMHNVFPRASLHIAELPIPHGM